MPTLKSNPESGITGYQLTLYDATLGKVTTFTISPTATSFTVATALAAGHSFVWNLRVLDGTVTGPVSVYLFFRAWGVTRQARFTAFLAASYLGKSVVIRSGDSMRKTASIGTLYGNFATTALISPMQLSALKLVRLYS